MITPDGHWSIMSENGDLLESSRDIEVIEPDPCDDGGGINSGDPNISGLGDDECDSQPGGPTPLGIEPDCDEKIIAAKVSRNMFISALGIGFTGSIISGGTLGKAAGVSIAITGLSYNIASYRRDTCLGLIEPPPEFPWNVSCKACL